METYVLQRRLFGRGENDFRPSHQSQEELSRKMNALQEKHHLPIWFYAPRVNGTTCVVDFQDECGEDHSDPWLLPAVRSGIIRTKGDADGGILRGTWGALALFNADCPALCLTENEKLALLHIGYRCLVPEDTTRENIIEVAMHHFDPAHVQAAIWGGIGPCCLVPGFDVKAELRDPKRCGRHCKFLSRCITRTTRHPNGQDVSVDLYELARLNLIALGVPRARIDLDPTCTCCITHGGQPLYWSHTRYKAGEQEVDGRNVVLAWLTLGRCVS